MKFKESKTVPIEQVQEWDKNPRYITEHDNERLKKQIKKHGLFKPLICFEDGDTYVALGGNMRIGAIRQLSEEGHDEFKQVWISVVETNSEKEKLEIALADNDRAGHYNEDELVPMLKEYEDFPMDDYHIDTAFTVGLDTMLDRYDMADVRARGPAEDESVDENPMERKKEVFDNARIKQIVLFFGTGEYEEMIDTFENLQKEFGVENNTDVVVKLVEYYKEKEHTE